MKMNYMNGNETDIEEHEEQAEGEVLIVGINNHAVDAIDSSKLARSGFPSFFYF